MSHCQIPSRVTEQREHQPQAEGCQKGAAREPVSGLKDVPSLIVSKGKQLSGTVREAAHSLSISSLPSFIFSNLSWGSGGLGGSGGKSSEIQGIRENTSLFED